MPSIKLILAAIGFGSLFGAADAQQAQPAKPTLAWAPKPARLIPYTAPNKPLWKLSDILKKHAGQQDWAETVVETHDFTGAYISMAPGEKTKTIFYADDRVFWVVQAGQIRFTIDGQEPFVASKGFLVQVPHRVPFRLETVGDVPSLRFEIRPAAESPIYPITEKPDSIPGTQYIRATFSGHGAYDALNKPALDFNKEIVQGGQPPPRTFLKDDRLAVEVFRGPPVPTPPPTSLGHYRANYPGLWFVLEGSEEFLIEGEPLISAQQGDVVFAPVGRWHRVTASGAGLSTRLAINARPGNLHWYPEGTGGGE
jgi:mannose-6-phosphate isomerase-like protein (cupin superfamily)